MGTVCGNVTSSYSAQQRQHLTCALEKRTGLRLEYTNHTQERKARQEGNFFYRVARVLSAWFLKTLWHYSRDRSLVLLRSTHRRKPRRVMDDEAAKKQCEEKGNEYVQQGFKASGPVKTSMKHAPADTVKVILGPGGGIVVLDEVDHSASTYGVTVIETRGKPCFAHNDAWVVFITPGG